MRDPTWPLAYLIVGGAAFFTIDYALGWGWLGWSLGMAEWIGVSALGARNLGR